MLCYVPSLDFVTAESQRAGRAAAKYVLEGGCPATEVLEVQNGEGVTYTVPQKIRLENVEKTADLFFRVNRILEDSEILVTSQEGEVLCRFKREHMAPGEMEHVLLPKVLLEKAKGTIQVSVRAKEE